jgi:hypothetical protein
MIENLGQEPYIAHKLDSLMESTGFNVLHFENKDIYLGKKAAKFSQKQERQF